jgi:hypothetical protein
MLCENKLIFPAPKDPGRRQPSGPTDYEEVTFPSADGTLLHGRYFEHPSPAGHLLYCHGNGDMVAWLGDYARWLRARHALSVFLFDYRGYGRSAGNPCETGVLEDSRAARDWLARRAEVDRSELILMGRSLGGAICVQLAVEETPRGLILQNTFTSLPDVAAYHFPWLPVRLLVKTQFNSAKVMPSVKCPILQSHGTADRLVPFPLGWRLFQLASSDKEFFRVEEASHNHPEPPEYDHAVDRFLKRLRQKS